MRRHPLAVFCHMLMSSLCFLTFRKPYPRGYKNRLIFVHAIIVIMEVGDIRLYKERWKAVEEIEQQELRAMTPEQHWQKLNAIVRFAIETDMEIDNNDGEMEVFLRWAKLKALYEVSQKP